MPYDAVTNPALTFGLAMAIGMTAQVLARHAQLPGIVLLLAAGVLAGPDVLGLVRPSELGAGLEIVVGVAVAIILFEGGLHLDLRRLSAEALVIRRLVTLGALVTGVGGAVAARLVMGWDWPIAVLFGTLVIVTGPTVVTPLLRRLKVTQPVSTILEAEGVLIDPIGAIIAVVALEFVGVEGAGWATLARPLTVLVGGALAGFGGGLAIALLLRLRRLVPEGLENVLVLSLVVALFEVSESWLPESGLAAVVAAGMTVGNMRTHVSDRLIEFKEQLTVLLIAVLFVLLAADVRMAEVRALGWPALGTVAVLMLIVRPVTAYLCTMGSSLTLKERTFIASLAPRGIVAAAVASLFAETLTARGEPGGTDLRALVFLVIAVTVAVHGLTGGVIARLLGVRRPGQRGWVILGANEVSLALADVLVEEEPDILFIDSNPDHVRRAEQRGFQTTQGQGLDNSVLLAAGLDSRLGCIGLTPNEEVNLLWATRVREETRTPRLYVALRGATGGLPAESVHRAGAVVLFGGGVPLGLWSARMAVGDAVLERWRHVRSTSRAHPVAWSASGQELVLPLAVQRPGRIRPMDDETVLGERDEIHVLVDRERREEADSLMRGWGLVPVAAEEVAT